METNHHLPRVYERTPDFDSKAEEMRLSFLDWKIVFALDGLKSAADVALEFGLTEPRANEVFNRLAESGIVAEFQLSLSEYRERIKSQPVVVKSPAPAVSVPASEPEPAPVAFEALPIRPTALDPSRFASPEQKTAGNGNGAEPRSESISASVSRSPRGAINFSLKKRFKLKSAIDFIHGHAGGGTLGELAVYRVFMQVPSDLLRETGLRKMDFNDDTIEIDNPKLRQAIVDAISKTLRVPLPVSYFLQ